MSIRINGEYFVLWRAVDSEGLELEVFLQKRRNKKAALRFLSRLLSSYPVPRVIVTDKLKSYNKPIKFMCPNTEHRSHKGLNNRVEPKVSEAKMPISRHEEKKKVLLNLNLQKVFRFYYLSWVRCVIFLPLV